MPSDLLISFQRCCAFHEIHPFEDGVCTVLSAYSKHGTLESPLAFQSVLVDKQARLKYTLILRDVRGTDTQPPVQQPVIGPEIELLQKGWQDELQAVR